MSSQQKRQEEQFEKLLFEEEGAFENALKKKKLPTPTPKTPRKKQPKKEVTPKPVKPKSRSMKKVNTPDELKQSGKKKSKSPDAMNGLCNGLQFDKLVERDTNQEGLIL